MSRDGPPPGNPRRRPAHGGRHRPCPLAAALSPGSAPAAPARRSDAPKERRRSAPSSSKARNRTFRENQQRRRRHRIACRPEANGSGPLRAPAERSGREQRADAWREAARSGDHRRGGVSPELQRHRNARRGRRTTRRARRPSAEPHGRSKWAHARRPGPRLRAAGGRSRRLRRGRTDRSTVLKPRAGPRDDASASRSSDGMRRRQRCRYNVTSVVGRSSSTSGGAEGRCSRPPSLSRAQAHRLHEVR
jgi:hypothetical protein